MLPWPEMIDPVADQNGFSGVVSVDRGGEIEFVQAYGLADRAHQIPNTPDTRFAIASGTKGLTAVRQQDRARRLGGRDGALPQRRARRVHALRPWLLARRARQHGDTRGTRRGCLV